MDEAQNNSSGRGPLLKKAGQAIIAAQRLDELMQEAKERRREERAKSMKGSVLRSCCKSATRENLTKTEEAHPGYQLAPNPWMTPTENILVPSDRYQGIAFRSGSTEPTYLGKSSRLAFHKVNLRSKRMSKILKDDPQEYIRRTPGLFENQLRWQGEVAGRTFTTAPALAG